MKFPFHFTKKFPFLESAIVEQPDNEPIFFTVSEEMNRYRDLLLNRKDPSKFLKKNMLNSSVVFNKKTVRKPVAELKIDDQHFYLYLTENNGKINFRLSTANTETLKKSSSKEEIKALDSVLFNDFSKTSSSTLKCLEDFSEDIMRNDFQKEFFKIAAGLCLKDFLKDRKNGSLLEDRLADFKKTHYSENKIKYFPKNKYELEKLVKEPTIDLDEIEVSKVKDFSHLFDCDWQRLPFRNNLEGIKKWNMHNAEDLSGMFTGKNFNVDISNWDVSNVKKMNNMFERSSFNHDLSRWDVSKVEDMQEMFTGSCFEGKGIENWNIANVKNMRNMFACANHFNANIAKWDISNVQDMQGILSHTNSFNQNLSHWLTSSNGLNFKKAFVSKNELASYFAYEDNSEISNLSAKVSSELKFLKLFPEFNLKQAEKFTEHSFAFQPKNSDELKELCNDPTVNLGDIDTSKITDMSRLFYKSKRKDLSGIEKWNVSNVTNMSDMFNNCDAVASVDLSKWDVSKVENFSYMFNKVGQSENFDQNSWKVNLKYWNVSSGKMFSHMFTDSCFNESLKDWTVNGAACREFSRSRSTNCNIDEYQREYDALIYKTPYRLDGSFDEMFTGTYRCRSGADLDEDGLVQDWPKSIAADQREKEFIKEHEFTQTYIEEPSLRI